MITHEQLTFTVPRGTRKWLREIKRKTGITPEDILRLGVTKVGRFVEAFNEAKNSENRKTK
jgi:hypothetical protein